jgi:hypothetical protein
MGPVSVDVHAVSCEEDAVDFFQNLLDKELVPMAGTHVPG